MYYVCYLHKFWCLLFINTKYHNIYHLHILYRSKRSNVNSFFRIKTSSKQEGYRDTSLQHKVQFIVIKPYLLGLFYISTYIFDFIVIVIMNIREHQYFVSSQKVFMIIRNDYFFILFKMQYKVLLTVLLSKQAQLL